MPTLHVVIPVYNERNTLEPCARRVLEVSLPESWSIRIWMVDDHSDDEHFALVQQVFDDLSAENLPVSLDRHEVNQGKGAALQTGFDRILAASPADDDLVVIQDADLEYDPGDFPAIMQPLLEGKADAVLGSRWGTHTKLVGLKRKIHAWGNRTLTFLSNVMTGYRVSDMECCYKIFSVSLLRRLRPMLTEQRFGIEPQMVASLSRLKARVTQVPISYDPRGLDGGKKIGWKDGVRAIWVISRERFRSRTVAPFETDQTSLDPVTPTDAGRG
ncbi:MAG: glycosyltransferase family 2 protein [Planctomycetes bacterium]|nr:glycosyltransferase family 2 protein [Planctomycetota bacterium]